MDTFAGCGFTDAYLEETADGTKAVVGSDAPACPSGSRQGDPGAPEAGRLRSEEHGTGGLEAFVPDHAEILRADTNLVCDTGNPAVGRPAATGSLRGMVNVVVHVEALASEVHSGMFRGAARDALAALVAMLASLRATTTATPSSGGWTTPRPGPSRRTRPISSRVTPASWGVSLVGDGSVSDMMWARPALTILGIDCSPVVGSAAAISPSAAARLNLRTRPAPSPSPRRLP